MKELMRGHKGREGAKDRRAELADERIKVNRGGGGAAQRGTGTKAKQEHSGAEGLRNQRTCCADETALMMRRKI